MKKRTALFKVLKNRFADFVDSKNFIYTVWTIFVIVSAIIGFNVVKTEPIPLTQDELQYYTEQAELGYNKGLNYLNDSIMLKTIDSTTANIYAIDKPDEKQGLTVTYLNGEIVSAKPYYSYWFLGDRIIGALLFAILGFIVFIPIACLLALIIEKIISIKEDVAYELKKANSVTDEED